MARYPRPSMLELPLAVRRQILFWLGMLALLVLFLVVFRDILLPFIAGMALAYFLDPVADMLERVGLPRWLATSLIMVFFVLIFVVALVRLGPLLGDQLDRFIRQLPTYVATLEARLPTAADLPKWLQDAVGESRPDLSENLNGVLTEGAQWLGAIVARIWSGGKALVDVISLLVITPIVAFYLLLDWDRMVGTVDGWLPREHAGSVRTIMRDIDAAIAGFVRGQGTVCLLLGLFYAIGLSLVGLNFGLLIGMFAGIVSFIPFVGSVVGLVLSVGVALVQFWPDYIWIVAVAAIFAAGQFIEGNILQPKLVGASVGLHPVWLMFALLAFGSLLGFTGLLIAVPVAAAIGVLVRFALARYLESPLYHGADGPMEAPVAEPLAQPLAERVAEPGE